MGAHRRTTRFDERRAGFVQSAGSFVWCLKKNMLPRMVQQRRRNLSPDRCVPALIASSFGRDCVRMGKFGMFAMVSSHDAVLGSELSWCAISLMVRRRLLKNSAREVRISGCDDLAAPLCGQPHRKLAAGR